MINLKAENFTVCIFFSSLQTLKHLKLLFSLEEQMHLDCLVIIFHIGKLIYKYYYF